MELNMIINENNIKDFLLLFVITIFTFNLNYKILDIKEKKKNLPIYFLILLVIDIIVIVIRNKAGTTMQIISLLIFIALIFSNKVNKNIGYSIMISTVSLSINYIICLISISISYFIFRFSNFNTYIVLMGILSIYVILYIAI